MSITYEPPKQKAVSVGKHIEGLGTVLDPDDEGMAALMENVGVKDDTDYIKGSDEPHAHLNACGTGELTVFVDPSKVETLTLLGGEAKHYALVALNDDDLRCNFCGANKQEVEYLVQSPIGICICEACAVDALHLMLERRRSK